MDIFTTALTKVRSTPIKPEKLRVKALRKEAATSPLTDDIDHLEDHELFFIDENKQQSNTKEQKQTADEQFELSKVKASEPVITHKEEILHPKKENKSSPDEDDVQHLDIYI